MAKVHYLYKIENKLNKKIYIGIHSTENMNDGYMGSSALVSKAIKKYGENHALYGKRAMNNEMNWKWVKKEEVEKYLNSGWKFDKLKSLKEI